MGLNMEFCLRESFQGLHWVSDQALSEQHNCCSHVNKSVFDALVLQLQQKSDATLASLKTELHHLFNADVFSVFYVTTENTTQNFCKLRN